MVASYQDKLDTVTNAAAQGSHISNNAPRYIFVPNNTVGECCRMHMYGG